MVLVAVVDTAATETTSNIETLEILKGPGSALYGRGEPGGTINLVTKKPQFEAQGHLNATVGNFDTQRFEADYTNHLSDSVAFRINGAYKDAGSFRDTIKTEKLDLTPSILFLLSNKTSLNYELEILDQKTPFDRGIVAIDLDPKVVDVETSMANLRMDRFTLKLPVISFFFSMR